MRVYVSNTKSYHLATSVLSPYWADAQPHTTNADDRVYELSNHLGNILATFTARKLPLTEAGAVVGFAPHLTSLSDYYPFGSAMKGRTVDGTYRYSFQGQETDAEYFNGAVSFKYRVHDARLGRFLSIDPLAPDYPWNSTYAFSENRVIDGVELEGLEWQRFEKRLPDGRLEITLTATVKVVNNTGKLSSKARLSDVELVAYAFAIAEQFKNSLSENSPDVVYRFEMSLVFSQSIDPVDGYDTVTDDDLVLSFEDEVDKLVEGADGTTRMSVAQGRADIGSTQSGVIRVVPLEAYEGRYTGERMSIDEIARTGAHEAGHNGGLNHPELEDADTKKEIDQAGRSKNLMRSGGSGTLVVRGQRDKISNVVNEQSSN